MNSGSIRVRFAPSPTGYLHIGSARTALFNWLFARKNRGSFLLRIEDTDRERSTREYTDSILESLRWMGLDWDEDIYIQSENVQHHREAVQRLLNNGTAYKCFCPPDILERKRKEAERQKVSYRYDGTCRRLSVEECAKKQEAGERYTVRLRIPPGETVCHDVIHGQTVFRHSEIDDFIIQRRDATPTYQLAVVVDDHDMNISHVIRGDDHLSNTPKQIMLYQSLGWKTPLFAHIPLILGPDKSRLSKRHGAVSVDLYRERGYLPETLRNFLLLLGWLPGDEEDLWETEKAVRKFKLEEINRSAAVFDERKLLWLNGKYISRLSEKELSERLAPVIARDEELRCLVGEKGHDYLLRVLTLLRTRIKLLTDFIGYAGYFYRDPLVYAPPAVKKHWKEPDVMERLARVRLRMIECEEFSEENVETEIRNLADSLHIPAAKLIHPVRLAVTGSGVSPGLFEVMQLLGRKTVVRRLEKAVSYLNRL